MIKQRTKELIKNTLANSFNLDNFKMTGDNISIIQYPKEYFRLSNFHQEV